MSNKKVIFVSYADEDKDKRNLLKDIPLTTANPFQFVDVPDGDVHDEKWREKTRNRILKSDAVIALISKHTLTSLGQRWEIDCASDEGKEMIGLWAYDDDTTRPAVIERYRTIHWTKEDISRFIDSL